MTVYTNVFGGSNIYPSDVSYLAVALTANTTFDWPLETAPGTNLVASIMDVTASAGPFTITLPDAREASNGQTILFNNVGANNFIVSTATGTQVVTLTSGTTWQIYLTNNTTEGGTWRAFQYGAATSTVNAASLAGAGLVAIGTLLNQSIPTQSVSTSYTAGTADRSQLLVWTGGAGVITLPTAVTTGDNWFIAINNNGVGTVTVDPAGADLIDGGSTKVFQPGDSAIIVCDGSAYYTIGFGQQAVFAFDYTAIDVSGTGDYTLTGTELNRIAYSFTGVLTGNRSIIVPQTIQQYWVDNNTTGSFTLTIKTSLSAGTTVTQNARAILYCDGTNVVNATTSGIGLPISIGDGGTGATTASGARTNLGGTATGVAVFTAASQAAAQVALGLDPISGGTYS